MRLPKTPLAPLAQCLHRMASRGCQSVCWFVCPSRHVRVLFPRCRQVGGHAVLKANMYDLQSGERSVFQQELSRELVLDMGVVVAGGWQADGSRRMNVGRDGGTHV